MSSSGSGGSLAFKAPPDLMDSLQERLIGWANLNSSSANGGGLAEMAGRLRAACLEITPEVSLVPITGDGRSAVRARMRPDAPIQILLAGHYDTVFSAEHSFQACRPSTATGRLNGPGVADMKGGIVLMLAALAAFERGPGIARLGWEVLLTPDEETGSIASQPLWTEAARRHHLGLVFEPARPNGDLVLGRKGVGCAVVTSRGRTAHAGAAAASGRNAIAALCVFWAGLADLPAEIPGLLLNIGRIRGGGPLNVVPDFAEAQLDLRVDHPADTGRVSDRLRDLARPISAREGHEIEVEVQFSRPPWAPDSSARRAGVAWQQCGRDLGLTPFASQTAGGGSDANLLAAAGLPCLDGLGPIGGNYHTAEEWIDLTSLADRARLATLFFTRLATGQLSLGADQF